MLRERNGFHFKGDLFYHLPKFLLVTLLELCYFCFTLGDLKVDSNYEFASTKC